MDTLVQAWSKKLAVDLIGVVIAIALIVGLPDQPQIAGGLILVGGLTRVLVRWDRRHAICWIGAIGLWLILEPAAVALGAWQFRDPEVLGLSAWILPLWAQTFLAMRAMYGLLDAWTRPYYPVFHFDRDGLGFIVLWIGSLLIIGPLSHLPLVLAAIHLGGAALIAIVDSREGDWILVLLGGVCGPLVEGLLVQGGHYTFAADPAAYGLPVFQPCFWMLTFLFFRRLRGRIEML